MTSVVFSLANRIRVRLRGPHNIRLSLWKEMPLSEMTKPLLLEGTLYSRTVDTMELDYTSTHHL